jgi:signal transduction histidine kinase
MGGLVERLAQLQQERDAARAELQEFVYTVSHDLRAPLRHITAFAQIIAEDLSDMPPDIAAHLVTIRQAVKLLTQQLDGLAALSRLVRQEVQGVVVDTTAVIQQVVEELAPRYAGRAVRWQVAPDFPPVLGDAALLGQVLMQVLDNACKFTRARSPAIITLSWQKLSASQCQISVQDNGTGFSPQQADRLFKVFSKLHPAREFEGLGLGLVQCRKMLARMGGSISVAGALDAGCCVTLTLPVSL